MLASELIEALDHLIGLHGDLPVVDENDEQVDVEFVDDEVFVIS